MKPAGLNTRQKEAVEHKDGPLLIIAGAGAGKTRVITERIRCLIESGVEPEQILAITFTNKAAKEMQERVEKLSASSFELLGTDGRKASNWKLTANSSPWIGTFHGLGATIIRENARGLGLTRHFKIFDRADGSGAVKEAMKRVGVDPKSFDPGRVMAVIGRYKGDLVDLSTFERDAHTESFARVLARVWREYENVLREEGALDFDDLLLRTVRLLEHEEPVRSSYQNRWRYVHVDEYQDTNEVQYALTRLLAGEHQNLCVVGDVDQNIYSWRGASIKNILDFEKDYPNAKVVTLEENYRSTGAILAVANHIIKKNRFRREKNLFTKNPAGEKLALFGAENEIDEAAFTAGKSRALIEEGTAPNEITILFRANFQSRVLEEAFLKEGVPYQVIGTRFFERKEVKDVVAYLRASFAEGGAGDLKRILNVPPRGFGKVTVLAVLSGAEAKLPAKTRERLAEFRSLLQKIKKKAGGGSVSETIRFIVKASGIEAALMEGGDDDLERLENVKELVSFAARYDNLPPEEGVEQFLSNAALQSDQDDLLARKDGVKLMTVHAAKGLEFDYVFVTGLEDGLFPHRRGMEAVTEEEAEEERRLFYVALTRARKKVFLSYGGTRMMFGSRELAIPSEFIFDVPEEFLEAEERVEFAKKTMYLD